MCRAIPKCLFLFLVILSCFAPQFTFSKAESATLPTILSPQGEEVPCR